MFYHPFLCTLISLININSTHNSFKRITKYLAAFKGIIKPVVLGKFLQSHFKGDLIQLLAVYHLAAHLGKKAFALVWIFPEQIMSHHRTEHRVAQELQALVVFIGAFANAAVAERCFVQGDITRRKAQYIIELLPEFPVIVLVFKQLFYE